MDARDCIIRNNMGKGYVSWGRYIAYFDVFFYNLVT